MKKFGIIAKYSIVIFVVWFGGKFGPYLINPSEALVRVSGWESYRAPKLKTINFLLWYGANINYISESNRGYTPLISAAIWNNPDVVELLLRSNADPSIGIGGNSKSSTAFDVACKSNAILALDVFSKRGIRATQEHKSTWTKGEEVSKLCGPL